MLIKLLNYSVNIHLNWNNTVSNQFIGDQFSIVPLNLIIHTFLPDSLRKTGSHPEPREHTLRNSTTINGFTTLSAVIF